MNLRLATLAVFLLAGCPTPTAPGDDGGTTSTDSGTTLPADAGAVTDAGNAIDAGTAIDAGDPLDGGGAIDAGPVDAGAPTAPETRITQRPTMPLSGSTSVAFSFECDQGVCTFACSWDQEPFASCTSPASRSGFSDGRHQFAVRASRDALTDLTPATESFAVDAMPPTVSFSTTPDAGAPNSRPSTFTPACNETPCTYECSLDGAPFTTCPAPIAFDGLAVGMHSLSLRGSDTAGNTSSAITHTWSLTFGWRSVAISRTTGCAITGDRRLACWGSDSSGQLGLGLMPGPESGTGAVPRPTLVGTATDWATVVAGESSFCATRTSGAVFCWGDNQGGMLGDPMLTAQSYSTPTPVAHRFTRLSFGSETACGIDAMGALLCWGRGDDGALGDGVLTPHSTITPQRVGLATWRAIAVRYHACGLQTDGSLWCFGPNESGEVGADPSTTTSLGVPTRVGTDTDWADVFAGDSFTCARKTSGAISCFGQNSQGQLASTAASSHVPAPVTGTWRSGVGSTVGACAVNASNEAFCWGDNAKGELGSTTAGEFATTPVRVETSSPLVEVAGYQRLRCARTISDGLECWGDNAGTSGGLGRGIAGRETMPVLLDGSYASLAVTGNSFTGPGFGGCGIKTTGQLVCWGSGWHLGRTNVFTSFTPTAVTADLDWTQVKVSATSSPLTGSGSGNTLSSSGHACGIRSGQLFCWGRNQHGQLGNGTSTASTTPVAVPPFQPGTTWVTVATGLSTTCGITSGGRLSCWGNNQLGSVGDGTVVTRLSPSGLAGTANTFTDWTQVAINGTRVIARRANGTLWQWGGGLGSTPTQVDTATDWAEGQPSTNYLCGRKTSGAVFCKLNAQAATQVGTLTDAVRLLEFSNRACVLRTNGVVSCITSNGTGWLLEAMNAPGTWKTLQYAPDLVCGIGVDDQRRCFGARIAGSYGDGLDERVPAPVLTP